jgi:ribosomal protein S18 acetylase RimI-like enzyme
MEQMNYEVAIGEMKDISTIAQFQVDMAFESEGTTLSVDRVLCGVTAVMSDCNKGTYLVARMDGRIVASLMITREWSDWNGEWYWWVQSVYVMPDFRGKGVYRAMYAKVKEMAIEEGVSQIRLYVDKTNHSAQQVYKRLGMKECHYLMYEDSVELINDL